MDRVLWVRLPQAARKFLLDSLQEDLDKAHQLLRTAAQAEDLWRAQGRAQYLHSLLCELKTLEKKEQANAGGS